MKPIMIWLGSISVDRSIKDKNALSEAIDVLNKDEVIAIFPEGTINRTDDTIMNFKIGAVKMAHDTDSLIVPFIITGKYRLFGIGNRIRLEYLEPIRISDDLDYENNRLMNIIKNKLEEENEKSK
jgi:1-acyl-sn-glycerol-3-phosphate acyltransferase